MQQQEPKVNSANVIAEGQIENKGEILKKMTENNPVLKNLSDIFKLTI